MKVQYKGNNPIVMETWIDEQEKGNSITIKKGDIFKTSQWGGIMGGYAESVVTDKHEWICDVDCKEFNELFGILENQ